MYLLLLLLLLLSFDHDFALDLAKYLNYLADNHTAYEEHRAWRNNFSEMKHRSMSKLLAHSWSCRVCQWAANFPIDPDTKSLKKNIADGNERC